MIFTLLVSRSCSLLHSTTPYAYILHTANILDLVVYLRSGQKLGPGLQHNGVMVLRQGEWAMRGRSCHVGGWIKEGVFIVYERSKVFERCYDVYEWYCVACENVQRRA